MPKAINREHTERSDKQSAVDGFRSTGAQPLEEGSPPLDLTIIKDFLRFVGSVSDKRIDNENEFVTADSLNTFAE